MNSFIEGVLLFLVVVIVLVLSTMIHLQADKKSLEKHKIEWQKEYEATRNRQLEKSEDNTDTNALYKVDAQLCVEGMYVFVTAINNIRTINIFGNRIEFLIPNK